MISLVLLVLSSEFDPTEKVGSAAGAGRRKYAERRQGNAEQSEEAPKG
jgi:hypothetical protein